MTLGKRRSIFYLLLVAFFAIGAIVVLYVNGWRIDPLKLKIEKVGAIFVRSFPQEAAIHLDNKLIDNGSGLFEKGTLINGLFPGNYKLKLTLDNYADWEESISVAPSLVTEAAYAVLVPKNSIVLATSTKKSFWIVGNDMVTQDRNDNLAVDGEKIGKGEVVAWTKNGEVALTRGPAAKSYYLIDLPKKEGLNISRLLKNNGLLKDNLGISLNPEDKNQLVISEAKKVFTFDAEESRVAKIYETTGEIGEKIAPSEFLIAWTKFNSRNNTSTIIVFDKFLKKVLDESPSLSGKNLDLKWASNKRLIILQDNGELNIYDFQNKTIKRISSNVKNFELLAGGSKLAAVENNSLEILPLDNDQGYHRFNFPEIQNVLGINWYGDGNHLFVFYPDRVVFLDLNDASLGNLITVTRDYKKAVYDAKNNYFYVLKETLMERFDFPK